MKTNGVVLGMWVLVAASSSPARARSVPHRLRILFSTGLDIVGNPDPNWSIIADASGGATPGACNRAGAQRWLASRKQRHFKVDWVTASGGDSVAAGTYTYQTISDLTGLDPSTATFTFQYSVDSD